MTKHEVAVRMYLMLCEKREGDVVPEPVATAALIREHLAAFESTMSELGLPHYEAASRYGGH
ncbi:hypothetical protein E4T66_09860 [Sinimarinibacterium sp. CAU 1509]|uniref:hypothetical protein n=1 Tax=Sinimarinibacterium sp. CAU 1509 TaxID=2562283 RepID=UPI0010ABC45D|nr:hypothetical protein [Sinimarinibacterium sp. CAU 1509]TJY60946.1 hypothetical protein E4T66_09860 [Sinimarinibacterium sp. CAU 1509]